MSATAPAGLRRWVFPASEKSPSRSDVALFSTVPLFRAPSGLMRPAHHLHGVLEVTPLASLLGLALALAGDRVLRGLVNGLGAVFLEHLARDHVDLHLGNHGALLMSINRSRKLRRRLFRQPPGPGFRSLTPP